MVFMIKYWFFLFCKIWS